MKRFCLIILIIGFCFSGESTVVINEVFYDALGSDEAKEWIELYNNGAEDVNLIGWSIQAGGRTFSDVYTFSSITIRAKSFFLISESPLPLSNIITELGFENGTTATDGIRLFNPRDQYTDTVLYDSPNINNLEGDSISQLPCENVNPGSSLARNNDGFDTNSADDWFACLVTSPGSTNIIEKVVTMQNCQAVTNGSSIDVSTVILNLCTWTVDNHDLSIKILFNSNLKHFEYLTDISISDSLSYCTSIENEFLVSGLLEVELINNSNVNIVDNLWMMWISYQVPALALSEIMYHPLSNQDEWIEVKLLNDLVKTEISIFDASGNTATAEISGLAGDYLVIAENKANVLKSFPSSDSLKIFQANGWTQLNNTGDVVVIKHFQTTLDSLEYEANATLAGYSLEYKELINDWERCNSAAGATPTEPNSLIEDSPTNANSGINIINSLISLKKDKRLIIQFNSQKLVDVIELNLFDLRGKELNKVTYNFFNQYSGEFIWDGHLQSSYLASGLYPAIVKIKAENGRVLEEKKLLITINR